MAYVVHEKYKDAVARCWLQGLTYTETAEKLGINENLVKTIRAKYEMVRSEKEHQEQIEFIRRLYFFGLDDHDIAEEFNDYYGTSKSQMAVQWMRRRAGFVNCEFVCSPRIMHRLAPHFIVTYNDTAVSRLTGISRNTVIKYRKIYADLMKEAA